jgi:hypothetical protein
MGMKRPLLLVSALALVAGCAVRPHHPVAQGEDIWYPLSSEDNVVPALEEGAAEAGCDVQSGLVGITTDRALVADCRGERVKLHQLGSWLVYRCDSLPLTSCENLVQAFAPKVPKERDRGHAGRRSGT